MRATNDAVGYYHGFGGVLSQEGEDLLANSWVGADIDVLGEPPLERIRLAAFVANDGHSDLGGEIGSRAVESNGGGGIAAESPPGFLAETMLQ
jgi:hypothetical protein